MKTYTIRHAVDADILRITELYNANDSFLASHMGCSSVDAAWVSNEMWEMEQAGFVSCVVADPDSGELVGLLDYRPDEPAYLSIIMIDAKHQGRGVGSAVYLQFEQSMRQLGKQSIRIDVVNDYQDNLVGYWERKGFVGDKQISLTWGDKQTTALVMYKSLT